MMERVEQDKQVQVPLRAASLRDSDSMVAHARNYTRLLGCK